MYFIITICHFLFFNFNLYMIISMCPAVDWMQHDLIKNGVCCCVFSAKKKQTFCSTLDDNVSCLYN